MEPTEEGQEESRTGSHDKVALDGEIPFNMVIQEGRGYRTRNQPHQAT